MRALIVAVLLVSFAGFAAAKPWWMRGVESNESDFLPPDVAFRVAANVEGNVIRVRWVIADGYYLYRQRMTIKAESPDLVIRSRAAPRHPQGRSVLRQPGNLQAAGGSHGDLLAHRRRRAPPRDQSDLPRLRRGGLVLSAHYQSDFSATRRRRCRPRGPPLGGCRHPRRRSGLSLGGLITAQGP